MARLLLSLRRALALSPASPPRVRSIDTDFSIFRGSSHGSSVTSTLTHAEGDRVVLHTKQPTLSKPLKRGEKIHLRRGYLEHDRIIGSRVRDAIPAHKGPELRLSLPTLEEYVALTPRLVTPIYSHDGNLIVSLLDIHANSPAEGKTQPPLEILESGTGHGSLTLHLARAIHAANTTPPPRPPRSQIQYLEERTTRPGEDAEKLDSKEATEYPIQREWDDWRAQRNAVIHTVDVSAKFSALAEKNVRGFRRGIYAGDVDFYVGRVEDWIAEQSRRRATTGLLTSVTGSRSPKPFLSHAILDMPSAHARITHVAPIMRRDGILVVFMPSITQIGDCVQLIRRLRLPFVQERVVELGMGLTSGRQWDVRLATKKSGADPSSWGSPEAETSAESDAATDTPDEIPIEEAPKEEEPVMVCRPKVGLRTVGGGFVGIWRRIEDPQR